MVTQPRRVAARSAARRLAALDGSPLGARVGYTVRGDRQAGPGTWVEFVTPGILLRRLLADPGLEGTDAVILDEVHERGLETDLLARHARRSPPAARRPHPGRHVGHPRRAPLRRPDRRHADRWRRRTTTAAARLRSSTVRPRCIRWRFNGHPRRDRGWTSGAWRGPSWTTWPTRQRHAHAAALAGGRDIDALVFLPGAREVSDVAARLRGRTGAEVLELHGQVGPAAAGPRRLRPWPRRTRPDHRLHRTRRVLPHCSGRPAGHRFRPVPRAAARRRPRHDRPRDGVLLPGVRGPARRPCRTPGPGHG